MSVIFSMSGRHNSYPFHVNHANPRSIPSFCRDVLLEQINASIDGNNTKGMKVNVALMERASSPHKNMRVLIAASVGNVLEWYDFVVYAIFAVQISHAFFPQKTQFTSLLATFITFGVGFLARPIGAIVLGAYGDRSGRGATLTLTVLLMASGTLGIALCPPAAKIGIAAPVIVVIARLIQGFSAGGEIGGAVALLSESAPSSRRAFYTSFQQMTQGGSFLLCGIMGIVVTSCFSRGQVDSWAWRIPFLFGAIIAPVGFYIRKQIDEPELYLTLRRQIGRARPLRSILTEHWKELLIGIGVTILMAVSIYVMFYLPTFAHSMLKIQQSSAYLGFVISGLVPILCPAAGILADRFSRKLVMFVAAVCLVIYPYPAFRYLTHHPTGSTLIAVQVGMMVFMAFYTGPVTALLGELFPTYARSTGVALTYGTAVAIFGGFTPAIISALASYTGNKLAVAFWLAASAALSAVSLLAVRDRSRQQLR